MAKQLLTHAYSVRVFLQISLFQQFPQLKACVRPAVEKAVQDLLLPVVERSIKIALTTTEHIIKKVNWWALALLS